VRRSAVQENLMQALKTTFAQLQPGVEFCALRVVETRGETLAVRQDVQEPFTRTVDRGAMITVLHRGGYGYAATSQLDAGGLQAAIDEAKRWAERSRAYSVFDYSKLQMPQPSGQYRSPEQAHPPKWRRSELLELLMQESQAAKLDARIVDWGATIALLESRQFYITHEAAVNGAAGVEQEFRFVMPGASVTAFADGDTQTRSLGGQYNGYCRQGGLEIVEAAGLIGAGRRVAEEALELLSAPNCPTEQMDLLLLPEQMMLQLHESIGHPLELDRILGDERNYAGTSFVTPEMFGTYRYGSELLNVAHDPTIANEFAAYGWDDDGAPAQKQLLIQDGILQRPLGGAISQARAGLPGVANARACSWNRPPIDRMANLNIEPGNATLAEMIGSVRRGVMMDTNVSWSIDDSRNKFQFGCERGVLIEDGQLTQVVKNPNYRGISATFWRSLKRVGDASTSQTMGTPFCGKGEPNQVIRVGHASPACLFGDIDIFGGEA
jgi:predicted Zn-dependent protease